MNFGDVLEITQQALWTTLKVGAPLLIITLVVGLIISLFQALTQIQESTLSFVPKVIAVFAATALFLPFMFSTLQGFTLELFQRMIQGS
ncbi:MAG: flagellar biosynthesis protein FliQ [Holosporales bacterium]|jgi:flagellar biosynthetic protein FliQ